MTPDPDSTVTSLSIRREPGGATRVQHTQLVLIAIAGDLRAPSSCHDLGGVDEVRFGRGPREARRSDEHGVRVLSLRVPDSRMSSDHGKLLRGPNGWMLDDPASKNGAIIDGRITHRAQLGKRALIQLGHTFFLFRDEVMHDPSAVGLGGDVDASQLPAALAALATFAPDLAAQFAPLARLAPTQVPVVLLGETGTGKEVVARALHELSGRRGPFVAVNCGALPRTLIEAELFGHRRGAFTGAQVDRAGLVRSADRGTLFLDEVAELPLESQAALLRVLQEQEVVPVGDDRPIKVDIRLCCATLRDLDALVDSGAFRPDLYARISGLTIKLLPLRARIADLGLLVPALLARAHGDAPVQLTQHAWRALCRHDWPFNIRELDKALATALAISGSGAIDASHLPASIQRSHSPPQPPQDGEPRDEPKDAPAPRAAELDPNDLALRDGLVTLLRAHGGNVVAVAAAMGKQRSQIYKWLRRLRIDLDAFRR